MTATTLAPPPTARLQPAIFVAHVFIHAGLVFVVEPMLAKLATALPSDGSFLYEPKWDGFRAIVFRGGNDLFIQSRELKPLDRYFPELHQLFLEQLPAGCVLDGEIVIATPRGLDFDALQMRLHPAASRLDMAATSASRALS